MGVCPIRSEWLYRGIAWPPARALSGTRRSSLEQSPEAGTGSRRRGRAEEGDGQPASGRSRFALLTPATKDRIDLGLNLPGEPGNGRLVVAGGMCAHKVGLRRAQDVNDELPGWLR